VYAAVQFLLFSVTLSDNSDIQSVTYIQFFGAFLYTYAVVASWLRPFLVSLFFSDLHMAQLMPLPLTVSCFSKIQIGFTLLVPAHLGSPG